MAKTQREVWEDSLAADWLHDELETLSGENRAYAATHWQQSERRPRDPNASLAGEAGRTIQLLRPTPEHRITSADLAHLMSLRIAATEIGRWFEEEWIAAYVEEADEDEDPAETAAYVAAMTARLQAVVRAFRINQDYFNGLGSFIDGEWFWFYIAKPRKPLDPVKLQIREYLERGEQKHREQQELDKATE